AENEKQCCPFSGKILRWESETLSPSWILPHHIQDLE
nr:hypothetical protein [Tanacetum cinerariifolium]